MMEEILRNRLKGKIAIIGVGNTMRGDDGFGPELVRRLNGKIEAECIDAGMSPENYTGKIIKARPDVVVFLDAVSMDEAAGTIKILEKEDISKVGFTTHDMPASLIIDYIKTQIDANIFMIGVQAENTGFDKVMSQEVKERIDYLEKLFKKLLRNENSFSLRRGYKK